MRQTLRTPLYAVVLGLAVLAFHERLSQADESKEAAPPIVLQIKALRTRNDDLDKQRKVQRTIIEQQEKKIAEARRAMRMASAHNNKKDLASAHQRQVDANSARVQAEYLAKQKRLEQDKHEQELNDLMAHAREKGIPIPTAPSRPSDLRDISRDFTHAGPGPLGPKTPKNLHDFTPHKPRVPSANGTLSRNIRHLLETGFLDRLLRPYERRAQDGTIGRPERQHQFQQSVFDGAHTYSNEVRIKGLNAELAQVNALIQQYGNSGATEAQFNAVTANQRRIIDELRSRGVNVKTGSTITIHVKP